MKFENFISTCGYLSLIIAVGILAFDKGKKHQEKKDAKFIKEAARVLSTLKKRKIRAASGKGNKEKRTMYHFEITLKACTDILDEMLAILNATGVVTLSEFYDICGVVSDKAEDYTYGWHTLVNAQVIRQRNGYQIILPDLEVL